MKRLILLAVVLAVGMSRAVWRGRFDEQFAAATASWTPAELNPIAWYKGDGNATDSVGGYDGTWEGTEAYADGVTGSSFYNASTNCIVIPHATTFNSTDHSISVWVNYSSTSGDRCIITKGSAEGFHLRLRTGTVDYAWNVNFNVLSTPLANNAWQHVVVVQSGTTATIYIDGVAVKTGFSGSLPVTTSDNPIRIFARFNAWNGSLSEHFAGQIDDVLLFDHALTAEEIEKLYNESINKNGEAW